VEKLPEIGMGIARLLPNEKNYFNFFYNWAIIVKFTM